MDRFSYCMPTHFEFGDDAELEVGRLVSRFSGTRALIVLGSGSAKRSGLYGRVRSSLDRALLDYVTLSGVSQASQRDLVYEGIDLARDEKVDFVLAIGGGSVIDVAKAIAAGVRYHGDVLDFFTGQAILDDALPIGCVLTTAASGSEASATATLPLGPGGQTVEAASNVLLPSFSVLNPALTATLPTYQVACNITETIAHLYGLYLADSQATGVSDRLIEGLMGAVIDGAPRAMDEQTDVRARADLMWAACMAHNNICMPGRVARPVSREISLRLSTATGQTLGACLAVMLPAVLQVVVSHDAGRMAQLARRIWGVAPTANDEADAKRGIDALRSFLLSLHMPSTCTELGVTREMLERAIEESGKIEPRAPFGGSQVIERLQDAEAAALVQSLAPISKAAAAA